MASKPVLTYFNGRGRAETIRLMLAATNQEWIDGTFLTKPEHIAKLRSDDKLMFGQVPLLEWHGLHLVQSMAITRYVAEKGGLYGKTAEDKAQIDMVTDGVRDFLSPFMVYKFVPDEKFAADTKAAIEKYLPKFEKLLESNASGSEYLCGGALSMADICLLEVLLTIEELKLGDLSKYPKISAHLARTRAVPSVAAYLASDKRSPPNTDVYIAEVKAVLGF